MNILEKLEFISGKLATALDNYLNLNLIKIQEKNWNKEEKDIAKEHINTMGMQIKALMAFEDDFKKTGDYNLNIHMSKVLVDVLEENLEFKDNTEVQHTIQTFKLALLTMKSNKEETMENLEVMETTADTILRLLK